MEERIHNNYRGEFKSGVEYIIENKVQSYQIIINFTSGIITDGSSIRIGNNVNNDNTFVVFNNCVFTEIRQWFLIIGEFKNIRFVNCDFQDVEIGNDKLKSLVIDHCIGKSIEICSKEIEDIRFTNAFFFSIEFQNLNNNAKFERISIHYFSKLIESYKDKLYKFFEVNPILFISSKYSLNVPYFEVVTNHKVEDENRHDVFKKFKFNINLDNRFSIGETTNRFIIHNIPNVDSLILIGHFNGLIVQKIKLHILSLIMFTTNQAQFDGVESLSKLDSIFDINNSTLDNCRFWNIDINQFKYFNVVKSIIDSASFLFIPLPNKISSNTDILALREKNKPEYPHSNQYEYFKQFFTLYSKSNDIEYALLAKSKMLNSLKEIIEVEGDKEKKWIFCLSKWSNNFGTNWWLALWLWIILLPLMCYLLLLLSTGKLFCINCKIDLSLIGQFFQFLLPTHRTDFLGSNVNLNGCSYFFDFLGRIITGFGIYQFITAFRRYGKS